jgi:1,6-anhydro-N-acetylmuramate kinase
MHKQKNEGAAEHWRYIKYYYPYKNYPKNNVIAFDTGPGNMIIGGMMYHLLKPFDKKGVIAKKEK